MSEKVMVPWESKRNEFEEQAERILGQGSLSVERLAGILHINYLRGYLEKVSIEDLPQWGEEYGVEIISAEPTEIQEEFDFGSDAP